MKTLILLFSFTVALSLFAPSTQAENICEYRAKARRHTALSQARQAYLA